MHLEGVGYESPLLLYILLVVLVPGLAHLVVEEFIPGHFFQFSFSAFAFLFFECILDTLLLFLGDLRDIGLFHVGALLSSGMYIIYPEV